jgi:hypothetical protein
MMIPFSFLIGRTVDTANPGCFSLITQRAKFGKSARGCRKTLVSSWIG